MSCNCIRVCDIPKCSESIFIGTIDPDITIIIQFKDIVTGRIKQVQATSDGEGELIADVSLINSFFSENFVYEITLLASNASQCNTSTWAIGETEDIECVTIGFVNVDVSDEEEFVADLQIQE